MWSHFDGGGCPGQAMGVRVRLDNSIGGFIPTKMISDKHVANPEERVKVSVHVKLSNFTCYSQPLYRMILVTVSKYIFVFCRPEWPYMLELPKLTLRDLR